MGDSNRMKWVFVDYENVGSLVGLEMGAYERLIVFCGPKHDELNLGKIPTKSFAKIDLLRMKKSSNNNLDFHLAFYLGRYDVEAAEGIEFVVFSNDTGFDGVVGHLMDLGRKCSRLGNGNHAVKKVGKKAGKKAAKKAGKKAAKKAVKKVAAKKAAKVVTAAIVTETLKGHVEKNRPSSRAKLEKWLLNRFSTQGLDEESLVVLLKRLELAGTVVFDGDKVSYRF